jgi:hypothetical protein
MNIPLFIELYDMAEKPVDNLNLRYDINPRFTVASSLWNKTCSESQ